MSTGFDPTLDERMAQFLRGDYAKSILRDEHEVAYQDQINVPEDIVVSTFQGNIGRDALDGRQPDGHNMANITGGWQVWPDTWMRFRFPKIEGYDRYYRIEFTGLYNHVSGTITDNNFRIETFGSTARYKVPYDASQPTFLNPGALKTGVFKVNPNNGFNVDLVYSYVGSDAGVDEWTNFEDNLGDIEFWMDYWRQLGNSAGGNWNTYIYDLIVWGRYIKRETA